MATNTVTLSINAGNSVQATNHLNVTYGPLIEKTMTLNVRPEEQDVSTPSNLRYPNIFGVITSYASVRDEMLAAASSAFEFWLNEDDAVYDEF